MMKINKKVTRLRRAKRGRMKMRELEVRRLCIHRTPCHTYAQIISAAGDRVEVSASTLHAELKKKLKSTRNIEAAKEVGQMIAKLALEAGIKKVAFDRSGFHYHGRVKALAEAARESGLEF